MNKMSTSNLSKNMLLENYADSSKKFESLSVRTRDSVLDLNTVARLMVAKYKNTYKGIPFLKDAISQHMYLKLIDEVKPKTIIDLGTAAGGSAMWFYDISRAHSDCQIVTIDLQDMRHQTCMEQSNICFIQEDVGNAAALKSILETRPHPWILSEDCHAPSALVMQTFAPHMTDGDYIIFEDTHPCAPDRPFMSADDMDNYTCEEWSKQKLKDVENEMLKRADFLIDASVQDMYGYNGATHINSVFCKKGR